MSNLLGAPGFGVVVSCSFQCKRARQLADLFNFERWSVFVLILHSLPWADVEQGWRWGWHGVGAGGTQRFSKDPQLTSSLLLFYTNRVTIRDEIAVNGL